MKGRSKREGALPKALFSVVIFALSTGRQAPRERDLSLWGHMREQKNAQLSDILVYHEGREEHEEKNRG